MSRLAGKPFFIGRMPSASGGRLLDFSANLSPDGVLSLQAQDAGSLRDYADPYFYLHIGGATISMNPSDMHECVDEMQYTRQKKARANPREIMDAQQLKNKVGDLIEAVKDAKVGRRRF